ncbi:AraC family transcriptional regulator [Myroides odoratimimus]|uniref:HTH araC/xylS-type domain-containing protein n=1 Tax=Myroides odoratimimus CCUG 10230 TaxID=883150 RepID=A0ABP2X1Q0_9FLAO|nr:MULTISPECIES: helix-turn-helix domain-containing protein [Myroides]AJA70119.1 AraC-type DNA-binding domain-containing protein [Myroides sp. A21]EPC08625.1 hypothetical protein HMPREF9712_03676 [Myroides odoratimimus CCUG 10230]MCA4792581.1 AraC family transcriptional regulator [Myroides odoratimimus]MCA4819977.1 AraC family transcriptional regulator [Myroides odoratimimus]MCO7723786.1 helix-turn-helix domain-containing protein [Myroides odoratimimus]
MHYREILPILPLRDYVRYFWVLENSNDKAEKQTFKILPDGIPTLIYQDRPNLFLDQYHQVAPQLYVYGQFSQFTDQSVEGSFRIIGAYLEPTALKALFKYDAIEFSNKNIALEDIVPNTLLEQLVHTDTIEEKIGLLSSFLLEQIQYNRFENKKIDYISLLLQKGKSLKEIQDEINISEKTLERLVKQYIGMSPKLFSRIMRFQSSLDLLRESKFKNLTTLSYQSDYYDQSHYIREFKEFTGVSPKEFIKSSDEQLINFPLFKSEE